MTDTQTSDRPAKAAVPGADRFDLGHFGIRVTDLDVSTAFYTDVFGFRTLDRRKVLGMAALLGAQHQDLEVQFLRHPSGMTIELVQAPGAAEATPYTTPLGYLGPSHINCRVHDVDVVCAAVRAYGGSVMTDTRWVLPTGRDIIFVQDPDGTRIEIVQTQLDGAPTVG